MNYVGNYAEWIKDEWINHILGNTGFARPAEGKKADSPQEEEEYTKLRNAGYKDDARYFYMFTAQNFPFNIENPPFTNQKFHWWFTKMSPGNFMPMHVDPHTLYQEGSNRYWMAFQDWQPGHIMMYEDKVITNYKKGDVYVYDNANALHGACNIGYVPRIILQVSTYD
jgi:hypothetical protein